jgi:hypothetical protein
MIHARSPNAALGSYGLPLALGLFFSAPACSSSPSHPSLIASNGGGDEEPAGGNAGSSAAGHSADAGDANESGDAGSPQGGTSNAGGAGDGAAGRPVAPGPSVCAQTASWSTPTSVEGVSTNVDETLLALTADELDLAFLRGGALYVAHRSKATDSFAAGSPITIPAGWSAQQGAALSGDGKRLVLVSDPDQKKLGELTRASRAQAFGGEVDESAFSDVNQNAIYTGKVYASPVVSSGDDQLFFNAAFPASASTIVVSTRSGEARWSAPVTLTPFVLDGDAGQRRLPTGVSSDLRTLFYFNEESSREEARFRSSSAITSPLYDMLSLAERRGAVPNSACDRLYSEADGDVVVEKD